MTGCGSNASRRRSPQTLIEARDQQRLTAGAVLALALIGIVLTAIALTLAGRLTTGVRAGETALFTALGTSRGQFAAAAVVEAGALAVVAVALAIPVSSGLHAALTRLPPLSGAGLAAPVTVTGAQVLAVGCGALALAILHVGLALRPVAPVGDRRGRSELLARSGADLLLVALAAVGWWQLRAQPAGAGTRADAVRVLAPALLLTACAALALRLVPPALRRAERLAAPRARAGPAAGRVRGRPPSTGGRRGPADRPGAARPPRSASPSAPPGNGRSTIRPTCPSAPTSPSPCRAAGRRAGRGGRRGHRRSDQPGQPSAASPSVSGWAAPATAPRLVAVDTTRAERCCAAGWTATAAGRAWAPRSRRRPVPGSPCRPGAPSP